LHHPVHGVSYCAIDGTVPPGMTVVVAGAVRGVTLVT